MRLNNPLLKGTLVLTLAGLVSRIIGFYYRIFLSHTIGAEGMGIYQMVFPVFALCFSITAAGLQTSISKHVAEQKEKGASYLCSGIALSLFFSFVCAVILYRYSDFFASSFLKEPRCAPLIRILALSVPFEAVHSCVNGYCLGCKKATLPAATQLIEQSIRVGSVCLIYYLITRQGLVPSLSVAVIGIVIGEFFSMTISLICIWLQFYRSTPALSIRVSYCTRLLKMSLPLTANRLVLNFLSSIEAICIPLRLQMHGLTRAEALSSYGILTGMALPLILFPSAITNSLSVMLVPAISDSQVHGGHSQIHNYTKKSIQYCLLLGACCTLFFLVFGRFLGTLLFHNETVGSYILLLSLLCPFLYLTSTLSGILHGLGKTSTTFTFSLLSLCVRLLFVFYAIPSYGMYGYLIGLLVSQFLHACLLVTALSVNDLLTPESKYTIIK